MISRFWCDCAAAVGCLLLRPGVKLGRLVAGPGGYEHEDCERPCQCEGPCNCGARRHECLDAGCRCEVPPPCWVPVRLDDVCEHVHPGDTAVVQLTVTNHGPTSRKFEISSSDPHVVLQPEALTLGPLEHGISVLSLTVPVTAPDGHNEHSVVSVRGCKQYNFRWTVQACRRRHHHDHGWGGLLPRRLHGRDAALCVAVEDRPDYVHHWYDHFYREQPCLNS